jgi:HlyD family secretion protein
VAAGDAYTKSDDAIRNKTDKTFTNSRRSNAQLTFSLNDSGLQNSLESGRVGLESMFSSWDAGDVSVAKQNTIQVKNFLDNLALALSVASPSGTITQAIIDGYKSDVSTARTNINIAISLIDGAEQASRVAAANVSLEKSNLALKEAPTEVNTVSAQEAVVAQIRASVRSLQAEVEKTLLRSPISGIIIKQDVKSGEIVSPNTPLVSVISKSKLEIEAFIPEADIAKIHIGDNALLTLDAYGDNVVFLAKVISLDPAETLIEGVATYKTTFQFDEDDVRAKSGMTANIDILTEQKNNVLALPGRVLTRKDNTVFVQILEGAVVRDVSIQTGIRGSDGYVEILSGLSDGQKVVVPKN